MFVTTKKKTIAGALVAVLVLAVSAALSACSQTPTSVPVRTFERAQRMDVACLKLYAPPPGSPTGPLDTIQPIGLTQGECAPVPSNVDGQGFENQLFAFVTQTTRGEIAVVDLSAGRLVDTSRAVPGINFLPVGAIPTDVAATPDGRMVFVASAEPNKPAIYGVPTRRVLGDTQGFPRDPEATTLGSWPVCVLPQRPGALAIVPRSGAPLPPAGDAGAGDGGAGDAGAAAPASDLPEYELVAVLPGDRGASAKIVTIDPRPFRRGGLPRLANGLPDYAKAKARDQGGEGFDPSLTEGDFLRPGEPVPCRVTSAIELSGESAVPKIVPQGKVWDDGVKYVDGGVDTTCDQPLKGAGCGLEPCCEGKEFKPVDSGAADAADAASEAGEAGAPEAGTPTADGGACEPLGPKDAGPVALDLGALEPPRLVSVVRDENTLYVADEGVPLIHVVDMSTPGAPKELPPFVATSLADPSRVVKIKELAISPPTREFKRFLYAVDRVDGSIMVYDVSDPATAERVPQTRPHPELNPFQPLDRIAFSSPVVAVTFARHEVPLGQIRGGKAPAAASGLLCNPNPNLDANPAADLGYFYRASSVDPGIDIGPRRLRGIFAFATLANGRVMVIDVDDWDAPCRRPDHLGDTSNDGVPLPPESALAAPQPLAAAGDLDPYHAPNAPNLSVTNEAFFPMSAPHSPRSEVLVRDDTTTGNQLPRMTGTPSVSAASVVLPLVGPGSENTPVLTSRFAFEVPDAHVNQDWSVTYEGALPGFDGIAARVSTERRGDYSSLVLTQTQAGFCQRGVEDWAIGADRAQKILAELQAAGAALPSEPLDRRMVDYVQLSEELLDPRDPYWGVTLGADDDAQCWDPRLATAGQRYEACLGTFGTVADNNPARDFPILEAYDDRLVLGRFYTPSGQRTREVVYKDPSNADMLKLMRCCFHHQVRFKVRAATEWVAVGKNVGADGGIGFLSHLTPGPGGRCVTSCDPREALLNGRVPAVSNVPSLAGYGRDSARVMRNPMFALAVANPTSGAVPARDTVYGFSTRGEFRYLSVAIGGTSAAVNPQSMRFIDALGQIGVVDAASQGLVLIDLRAVTVARAPYF